MLQNVSRRRPSVASSTVADPSTVTVRIESASTSDLNVQDVVTASSSDDDDDDDESNFRARSVRPSARSSSATNPVQTSVVRKSVAKSAQQKLSARLSTDIGHPIRLPKPRPTTAVSLPSKTSMFDNEWDLDFEQTLPSPTNQRNLSASPTTTRSKTPSPSSTRPKLTIHQAPLIFTTTSERFNDDLRTQMRRDMPRRSQSLAKPTMTISDPSSPTVPSVFLTDDILLGSIRALQNERQLCRLSVEYLIDATNMRPDELARKAMIGTRLPCQCGHTHSRCTLTLEFDQLCLNTSSSFSSGLSTGINGEFTSQLTSTKTRDLNRTQLGKLFSAVNRFIVKAQQEDKRILIYGFELTPNSPLAVIAIQYLMLIEDHLSVSDAAQRVHRLFPVSTSKHPNTLTMDKRFLDYLKQLEKKSNSKMYLSHRVSGDGGSSSSNEHRNSSRDLSWEASDVISHNNTSLTSWTTMPMPIVNDHSDQTQTFFKTRSAWDS